VISVMSEEKNIITIDGPSGVGKSTVSRRVAGTMGYTYLDTGAMYRAVGLFLDRLGVDIDHPETLSKSLDTLKLELLAAVDELSDVRVLLNGEDISDIIRTPKAAMTASRVSAIPVVREKLTEMQRFIGAKGNVVAEGRDIGTVVFPEAKHKFFLDAEPEERAHRRVLQLRERGVEADEAEVLALTLERDQNDRERDISPLKQADDALKIDSTHITIEEVVTKILQKVASP
jgi:cytidylate kinase